jgi:hypothetical protein
VLPAPAAAVPDPPAPRYAAPVVAPPVAQPAAPARTGRANLMNIFQDGWKR